MPKAHVPPPKTLGGGRSAASKLLATVAVPEADAEAYRNVTVNVPIGKLSPDPKQPRRHFNPAALRELAETIKARGILQPLLVRQVGSAYEIIAGERRWRAAQLAALSEVPVWVRNDLSDDEVRWARAVENLNREALNAFEIARAVVDYLGGLLGLDQDRTMSLLHRADNLRKKFRGELAQREATPDEIRDFLGISHAGSEVALPVVLWFENRISEYGKLSLVSFVRNQMPTLKWPPELQEAVMGGLEYTKATLLARVTLSEELLEWAKRHSLSELRARLAQPARTNTYHLERLMGLKQSYRAVRDQLPPESKAEFARLLEEATPALDRLNTFLAQQLKARPLP
jgi:ParB family chromosome partitioning protein